MKSTTMDGREPTPGGYEGIPRCVHKQNDGSSISHVIFGEFSGRLRRHPESAKSRYRTGLDAARPQPAPQTRADRTQSRALRSEK